MLGEKEMLTAQSGRSRRREEESSKEGKEALYDGAQRRQNSACMCM